MVEFQYYFKEHMGRNEEEKALSVNANNLH